MLNNIEFTASMPEGFLKRSGGADGRQPRTTETKTLIKFVNSDAPYCLLEYDAERDVKRAISCLYTYIRNHKMGVAISHRKNTILLQKSE